MTHTTTADLLEDTYGPPSWYRPAGVSLTGIYDFASSLITIEVPDEFSAVSHPARFLLQRWIDASAAIGMNPMLLHQLKPKTGADVLEPTRAITIVALIITMPRVPLERRIRVAAVLLDDSFIIVDLPDEYRPIARASARAGQKATQMAAA